uniref:Uncharacterized protein n=1 Tax=viral metagenome TaxID=1070528 RepID=A0A6M3LMJ7_9ZZZZ
MDNFTEREKHLKVLRKLGWNTTLLSMMTDYEVEKIAVNKVTSVTIVQNKETELPKQ